MITDKIHDRWPAIREEIQSMYQYPDNWDGMGAKAPMPRLIASAMGFLEKLRFEAPSLPPSAVSATPLGRIVLIWQNGGYREAEIVAIGKVEWMTVSGDREAAAAAAVAAGSVPITTRR